MRSRGVSGEASTLLKRGRAYIDKKLAGVLHFIMFSLPNILLSLMHAIRLNLTWNLSLKYQASFLTTSKRPFPRWNKIKGREKDRKMVPRCRPHHHRGIKTTGSFPSHLTRPPTRPNERTRLSRATIQTQPEYQELTAS